MERNKEENGILINYMAVLSHRIQINRAIGETIRMISEMDMEYLSGLMDRNISGNTTIMSETGMEYTRGQLELCIMESTIRVKVRVMAITCVTVAMNTSASTRMVENGDKGSIKKMTNFSESSMSKAS